MPHTQAPSPWTSQEYRLKIHAMRHAPSTSSKTVFSTPVTCVPALRARNKVRHPSADQIAIGDVAGGIISRKCTWNTGPRSMVEDSPAAKGCIPQSGDCPRRVGRFGLRVDGLLSTPSKRRGHFAITHLRLLHAFLDNRRVAPHRAMLARCSPSLTWHLLTASLRRGRCSCNGPAITQRHTRLKVSCASSLSQRLCSVVSPDDDDGLDETYPHSRHLRIARIAIGRPTYSLTPRYSTSI